MDVTPAEQKIMKRESGYRLAAQNPNSSAFGLWQCIYSTCKRAEAATGYKARTTNPYHAIQQMRWYIARGSKHKTAERALAHQIKHASY